MMAEKDPVAAAAQKYKPMQSAVPGTTLGPIQIEAFQGGGVSCKTCLVAFDAFFLYGYYLELFLETRYLVMLEILWLGFCSL